MNREAVFSHRLDRLIELDKKVIVFIVFTLSSYTNLNWCFIALRVIFAEGHLLCLPLLFATIHQIYWYF